jgi:hypothetical protein
VLAELQSTTDKTQQTKSRGEVARIVSFVNAANAAMGPTNRPHTTKRKPQAPSTRTSAHATAKSQETATHTMVSPR